MLKLCGGLLLSNGVIAWTFITLALAVKGIAKNINNNIKYISVVSNNEIEIIKTNGRGKNE